MNHKKLKRQLQNKPVSLTAKEVARLKREAVNNAAEIVNLIPLLVLRDKFGFGKVRLCRYLEFFNETLEAYNEGRFDLKDIEQVMLDEVKIGFEKGDELKEVAE